MALNALQTEYILELLNIPPNSIVYKIDNLGLNATRVIGDGALPAVTAVGQVIAGLNASQQAIVTKYLNNWAAIVYTSQGMSFQNSQISQNVTGFTLNFREAEEAYKAKIKHYVPFWDTYETRTTQSQQIQSMSAAVMM